ncbi:MAG: AAA family ATPase [Candidatus Sumerlaeota bacterium]|nr:AAA family ATPase [Candidatus Sumerlaeota bacterium]
MIRKNGKSHGVAAYPALNEDKPIAELVDSPTASVSAALAPEQNSSLPLRHFHMRSHPFLDNVNPEFFFRTEAHEEAFLRMKQCVEDDVAVGLTAAISGTGKTLLTQILLQELDPRRFKPILILVYPGMTRVALLREIVSELERDPDPARRLSVHYMISAIDDEIVRLQRRGVKLVIILDEVHFLSTDSLHILRTLSNIETPERKLVTLLLFGEDCLLKRMEHPIYRSLLSRIFERVTLRPLNRDEVEQYVKFRCLMVGAGPNLFLPETFNRIHELSGGIPREVNRICHAALGRAARKGAIRVNLSEVE